MGMANNTPAIVDEVEENAAPSFAAVSLPAGPAWELEFQEWCDDVERARDAEMGFGDAR